MGPTQCGPVSLVLTVEFAAVPFALGDASGYWESLESH